MRTLEEEIADLVRNVVAYAPREPRISARSLDFLASVYRAVEEAKSEAPKIFERERERQSTASRLPEVDWR